MNYIVYHKADFDGYFSAIITASEITRRDSKAQIIFIGFNYEKVLMLNKETEFNPEILTKDDNVYFVDAFYRNWEWYSKAKEAMGHEPVVIDHHETTFDFFKEHEFEISKEFEKPIFYEKGENGHFVLSSSWKGENGETLLFSAAIMCWYYFNAKIEDLKQIFETGYVDKNKFYVPKYIELISRYDVWDKHDNSVWANHILPFQFGLRSDTRIKTDDVVRSEFTKLFYLFRKKLGADINQKNEEGYNINWQRYREYEDKFFGKYWNTVLRGKSILSYIEERNKKVVKISGKKCVLEIRGKDRELLINPLEKPLNCFFATDYMNNSMLFENGLKDHFKEYDYLISLGPNMDYMSVSNEGDGILCNIQIISGNSNSDCSSVAKLLGGGGHKAIAGCKAYARIDSTYKENEEAEKVLILCLTSDEAVKK